jgi:uncharacterized protein YdbL (DUF1318 family)
MRSPRNLRRNVMKTVFKSALIALMLASTAPMALANPAIDQAKVAGIIGERADGYLAFVDPSKADADLRRQVDDINAKRRDVYTQLAQQQGATIAVVGALTAEKLIANTPSGQYVMGANGTWTRK